MGKAGKLAIIFWAQISCEKNIWPSKLKGALPVKPRFQPFLGKKTEDHAKPNKDEESGLYDVPRFWKKWCSRTSRTDPMQEFYDDRSASELAQH